VFYRGLYSYRQRLRVINLFPNIFSYWVCILSEFAKGFERKVCRVQVAHLHKLAQALSSLSRCFQLLLVYYLFSEIALQTKSGKYFQIWFFPRFGGKKWRNYEHAHASYPGLSFRPPGFSPYMGREERRVQGLDYGQVKHLLLNSCTSWFSVYHKCSTEWHCLPRTSLQWDRNLV